MILQEDEEEEERICVRLVMTYIETRTGTMRTLRCNTLRDTIRSICEIQDVTRCYSIKIQA